MDNTDAAHEVAQWAVDNLYADGDTLHLVCVLGCSSYWAFLSLCQAFFLSNFVLLPFFVFGNVSSPLIPSLPLQQIHCFTALKTAVG